MANILTTIRDGIHSFLITGTNSFKTSITQTESSTDYYNLFYHQGEQVLPGTQVDVDFPYVVFDVLPLSTDRDSATKTYECIVQFNVAALTADNSEDVMGYLIDKLEDSESSLIFTNYNLIRIDKQPIVPLGKIDNVWNISIPYLITIEQ